MLYYMFDHLDQSINQLVIQDVQDGLCNIVPGLLLEYEFESLSGGSDCLDIKSCLGVPIVLVVLMCL